jgi:hypothetical protein
VIFDTLISISYRYFWHFPLIILILFSFIVSIRFPLNILIISIFFSNFSFIVRNIELKVNSFFLAFLTILDSALIKSKKDISVYATWTHTRTAFNKISKSKNKARLLYCAYCTKKSLYSNIVITNFRKYLKLIYQINVEEELN